MIRLVPVQLLLAFKYCVQSLGPYGAWLQSMETVFSRRTKTEIFPANPGRCESCKILWVMTGAEHLTWLDPLSFLEGERGGERGNTHRGGSSYPQALLWLRGTEVSSSI